MATTIDLDPIRNQAPIEASECETKKFARETILADLAQLVLGIAREINLYAEGKDGLPRLTASEINVMRYIQEHPGTLPRDAAQDVGLHRSNMSVVLHGLCAKSLIDMVPDQQDGRKIRLFATREAQANLERRRARWSAFLADTDSDQTGLLDCLAALTRIDASLLAMRKKRTLS